VLVPQCRLVWHVRMAVVDDEPEAIVRWTSCQIAYTPESLADGRAALEAEIGSPINLEGFRSIKSSCSLCGTESSESVDDRNLAVAFTGGMIGLVKKLEVLASRIDITYGERATTDYISTVNSESCLRLPIPEGSFVRAPVARSLAVAAAWRSRGSSHSHSYGVGATATMGDRPRAYLSVVELDHNFTVKELVACEAKGMKMTSYGFDNWARFLNSEGPEGRESNVVTLDVDIPQGEFARHEQDAQMAEAAKIVVEWAISSKNARVSLATLQSNIQESILSINRSESVEAALAHVAEAYSANRAEPYPLGKVKVVVRLSGLARVPPLLLAVSGASSAILELTELPASSREPRQPLELAQKALARAAVVLSTWIDLGHGRQKVPPEVVLGVGATSDGLLILQNCSPGAPSGLGDVSLVKPLVELPGPLNAYEVASAFADAMLRIVLPDCAAVQPK